MFFFVSLVRSVRGGGKQNEKSQLPLQRCYNFAFDKTSHPSKDCLKKEKKMSRDGKNKNLLLQTSFFLNRVKVEVK